VETYCREIRLSERKSCSSRLGGYESQDENRHEFEEEEKSKANTSSSETRYPTNCVVLGILIGRRSGGSAKVMNGNKAVQRQLEELKRHNRVMEGNGLYLASYKSGQGVSTKKKTSKKH